MRLKISGLSVSMMAAVASSWRRRAWSKRNLAMTLTEDRGALSCSALNVTIRREMASSAADAGSMPTKAARTAAHERAIKEVFIGGAFLLGGRERGRSEFHPEGNRLTVSKG